MLPTLSDWVIVFDLDDTLYKEADYVESGIRAVATALEQLYQADLCEVLLQARSDGVLDLWQYACELLRLPAEVKESLLWIYRLHRPDIKLEEPVRLLLDDLTNAGAILAIVTDGRAVTQRLKLDALGLTALPVFISEEHASPKPEPMRFAAICTRWSKKQYVYIADNPAKDFLGPNTLGWLTIGLLGDSRNIHDQPATDEPDTSPKYWVQDLSEIERLLRS